MSVPVGEKKISCWLRQLQRQEMIFQFDRCGNRAVKYSIINVHLYQGQKMMIIIVTADDDDSTPFFLHPALQLRRLIEIFINFVVVVVLRFRRPSIRSVQKTNKKCGMIIPNRQKFQNCFHFMHKAVFHRKKYKYIFIFFTLSAMFLLPPQWNRSFVHAQSRLDVYLRGERLKAQAINIRQRSLTLGFVRKHAACLPAGWEGVGEMKTTLILFSIQTKMHPFPNFPTSSK